MRFLRMATNSLLAGALGAAYLTVLLLQLNPHIPLVSNSTAGWFATLWLFYGIHLAVLFYLLLVGREFFALDRFSPGWISVRLLAWFGAVTAAAAAVLMWLNLDGLGGTLTELAVRRMTIGAFATSIAAIVLLGIAVAHYSFGRRGSRVGAALFVLAVFASLALPLAARGPADAPQTVTQVDGGGSAAAPPHGPRVVMILLDGASLDYIWPRAAEGRLPHFRRVLEEGASLSLATIRPTQPSPVWASVATGMNPSRTGVRSAATYYAAWDSRGIEVLPDHCLSHVLTRLGFVRTVPSTSATWRSRPLWSVLARAGMTVGLVRWPLTHPASEVPGYVVSDRYHQLGDSITEITRAVYPPEAFLRVQALAPHREGSPAAAAERALDAPPGAPELSALRRDGLYSEISRALEAESPPRFMAIRLAGLDTIGHHYLQYTEPPRLREVTDAERRRKTQIVERYYAYIDDEVGAALARLSPGDLLVVVSGFGMQRLNPVKRMLDRLLGGTEFTGTHERAPDGFLLAFGSDVAAGGHPRGAIVDVAPTLLYFLGLPVARDMDGYARTDIFARTFTAERPIAFIPSYSR
ncbi:hypothetical protein BH23ACI1_BH23ACI1_05670 [soil metagenome]|nr:alkaline phosphatase family protein [Acidobacteriota bacterium]